MVHDAEHGTGGHPGDTPVARTVAALVGTLAVLAVWNLAVRPATASQYHLPLGLVVAALVVALGLWAGLGLPGLGLSPQRAASGLAWGGAAAGLVLAVVLVGALLPATHGSYNVPRAHTDLGDMLRQVLAVIPLRTVLVEELAFRGTLLGLLGVLLPRWWAVACCSLLFGLWHLGGIVTSTSGTAAHVALVGLGTVAATGAAGVVLCWLRLRSDSLLAPVLAHLAVDTLPLVAAWVVVH
jgi:membrane protease YdiL (CAAX protease family)